MGLQGNHWPSHGGTRGTHQHLCMDNLLDEFKVHKYNAKKLNAGTTFHLRLSMEQYGIISTCSSQIPPSNWPFKQLGTVIEVLRSSETLSSQCMTTNCHDSCIKTIDPRIIHHLCVVPYIAAWLIGEDIGTDVDGGWEEMQRGNTRETIDASNNSKSDA